MTLQEFIEKAKTDAALNEKVNAAIMEKVIMPMAQAEGVELSDEEWELLGVPELMYLRRSIFHVMTVHFMPFK